MDLLDGVTYRDICDNYIGIWDMLVDSNNDLFLVEPSYYRGCWAEITNKKGVPRTVNFVKGSSNKLEVLRRGIIFEFDSFITFSEEEKYFVLFKVKDHLNIYRQLVHKNRKE